MGFSRIFWDSWGFLKVSEDVPKFYEALDGIPWDSLGFWMRFFEILWDSLRFFEILWDSLGFWMGFFEILWIGWARTTRDRSIVTNWQWILSFLLLLLLLLLLLILLFLHLLFFHFLFFLLQVSRKNRLAHLHSFFTPIDFQQLASIQIPAEFSGILWDLLGFSGILGDWRFFGGVFRGWRFSRINFGRFQLVLRSSLLAPESILEILPHPEGCFRVPADVWRILLTRLPRSCIFPLRICGNSPESRPQSIRIRQTLPRILQEYLNWWSWPSHPPSQTHSPPPIILLGEREKERKRWEGGCERVREGGGGGGGSNLHTGGWWCKINEP